MNGFPFLAASLAITLSPVEVKNHHHGWLCTKGNLATEAGNEHQETFLFLNIHDNVPANFLSAANCSAAPGDQNLFFRLAAIYYPIMWLQTPPPRLHFVLCSQHVMQK